MGDSCLIITKKIMDSEFIEQNKIIKVGTRKSEVSFTFNYVHITDVFHSKNLTINNFSIKNVCYSWLWFRPIMSYLN